MVDNAIRFGDEVAEAMRTGGPVVALESTIIAHGLPSPRNVEVAAQIEQTVRDHGAVPATIGMVGGTVVVGLDEAQVRHLGTADGVAKLSVRDLVVAAAKGADGATTVASTAALAARAGIRVFATGGLGGVHRGASESYDESADLTSLSRTEILVVCAGVKSILDVGATLERLETLGVTVIGYGSRRFAGFYLTDSGFDLDWDLDSPAELAATLHLRDSLGLGPGAIVVSNPLPFDVQLDPDLHDRVLADGLDGSGPRGDHRQECDAVPVGPLPRGNPRGKPRGQHRGHPPQRRPGRRNRRGPRVRTTGLNGPTSMTGVRIPVGRVLVVGDIVTDILAVHSEPLAVDSDTPASISLTGGGSAANTAAWLAATGAAVDLLARRGGGRRRRRPPGRARRGGGRLWTDPPHRGRPDRQRDRAGTGAESDHAHRAGCQP